MESHLNISFLPLHTRFDLIEQCAIMLNKEWPRSNAARLFGLEKSNDNLPCSFILVERNGSENVIGHSRLSTIKGHQNTCLLESVLIKKERRGQGFGKLIMTETEEFAKQKGIETIYLSTKDKEEFYKHLGYECCEPLNLYGSQITLPAKPKFRSEVISSAVADENINLNIQIPQPPVPPPLPSFLKSIFPNKNKNKQWMRKDL